MLRRIGIAGLGYVGLCTGVCFAARGFEVVGVDAQRDKVEALGNGKVIIFERGLRKHLRRAISRSKLSFGSDDNALADSEYVFIAVGTPNRDDGRIDLSQVTAASKSIGKLLPKMTGYPLIVMKSTIIPWYFENRGQAALGGGFRIEGRKGLRTLFESGISEGRFRDRRYSPSRQSCHRRR